MWVSQPLEKQSCEQTLKLAAMVGQQVYLKMLEKFKTNAICLLLTRAQLGHYTTVQIETLNYITDKTLQSLLYRVQIGFSHRENLTESQKSHFRGLVGAPPPHSIQHTTPCTLKGFCGLVVSVSVQLKCQWSTAAFPSDSFDFIKRSCFVLFINRPE